MTDAKTVMAVGGFLLDVYLEAHASAEARQTGRPRPARGPDFGDVLKKAGGSSSLLDLRGALTTLGGTNTVTTKATEGATEATPTTSPPAAPAPTGQTASEAIARNPEAELAAIFVEADAARAKLEETRHAVALDGQVQMLVEHLGERLGALQRELSTGLTDLNARMALLEAAARQEQLPGAGGPSKPGAVEAAAPDDTAAPVVTLACMAANSPVATEPSLVTLSDHAELTTTAAANPTGERHTNLEGDK